MPRTQRSLFAVLTVTATLFVAACGSSGGSDAGSDDGKSEGTTTTEAVSTEEAQRRADSVDLEVSDFPDGWKSSPASPDDEDSPLKDCDPSFTDEDAKVAKHATDDFNLGSIEKADGTNFAAETVVFTDADTAEAAVAVFDDEDVVSCVDDAVKETLGSSTGLEVEGSLAEDDVDLGTDSSAGISGSYTLTADDGSVVNATVAVLAFNTGDLGTMVTILSFGDGLDPTTLRQPVEKLADLQGEA